ncbi:MAG TPA: holo-[acyl-carrier-protein] synthase [Desulfotomaculum sp.]|nr:holo-[acyl-carrier-protein] synthase [Desulfotomaculum sp.]
MVIGIGTDIIEVERVNRAYSRWGERFLRRVYTPAERSYCLKKANAACCFAGRFAAKEAVLKALGTGHKGSGFGEVEVTNDDAGKPLVILRGRAAAVAREKGVSAVHLSISHDAAHAVAFAVTEKI